MPALTASIASTNLTREESNVRPYIVSKNYDWAFFILAPIWALVFGLLLGETPLGKPHYSLYGRQESALSIFSGIFTAAHLVIVFFRSHANPKIFKTYPMRFLAVPILLLSVMLLSSWMTIFVFVVSVWWDVYHSSLQTFGLGRLYDSKLNEDREIGRRLDYGLNLVLYAGPIFAGLSLAQHVMHFKEFAAVGSPHLAALANLIMNHHSAWTALSAGISVPYLIYYLWSYQKLAKRGYAVSREKTALLVCTGLCSVWAWGFNPFGQAFFIMNFFHSLQYFALIAHTENDPLKSRLGLSRFRFGSMLTTLIIILSALAYGIWVEFQGESSHLAFCILISVTILHFWYDGFIWSVRKNQV